MGGLGLHDIEIIHAFCPFDAVKFGSRFLLNRCPNELSTAAFSFKHGRVANVVAERSITAYAIGYSYGSLGLSEKVMLSEGNPRKYRCRAERYTYSCHPEAHDLIEEGQKSNCPIKCRLIYWCPRSIKQFTSGWHEYTSLV